MSKIKDLHKIWSRNPEYREAYKKLAPEFEVAKVLIKAHLTYELTQGN